MAANTTTDQIITFDEGELEIAVVTYNRCEFIEEWLERCYEQARRRNIHLSVWDSSTNDETEDYINAFKMERNDRDMEYHRVDSDITIGYKSMLPILNSESKYVWVSGDSRCHDFDLLDQKAFPYLKQGIDYEVLYISNNEENDGKIYTDREEFFRDCFVSMTCIGLSIYKTSLFEPLKNNVQLRAGCDQKYKNNEAFGWIGYFLEMFSMKAHTAVFSVIPIINIKSDKKVFSWIKKYYSCWIEDLCNLMDALSDRYYCTETVIRDVWKIVLLDVPFVCYEARKSGDLNKETYRKYKENGMLDRCTKHGDRLEHFANAADEELDNLLERELEEEKKAFEDLCYRNMGKIKEASKGRELWIYGAGVGGKILARCLAEYNISVCGFLDKAADSIDFCEGMPVKTIDDIEPEECYVVISLRRWTSFCLSSLLKRGMERNHIFYISFECD